MNMIHPVERKGFRALRRAHYEFIEYEISEYLFWSMIPDYGQFCWVV